MNTPYIDSYRFGQIIINGQVHTRDVIILPDSVQGDWWRKSGHNLTIGDLQPVFSAGPEVLVIGRGAVKRMKVPSETRQALGEAGIEVIALSSNEACQRYNELCQTRRVAAAIHLTC